jgi:secondary thiamine-phosphate synthase enzyme
MGKIPYILKRFGVSNNYSEFLQIVYFCKSNRAFMIQQKEISLPPFQRGFHLITRYIEQELPDLPDAGLVNLLLKHTSAAITLNENADPTVRTDFESFISRLVPENQPYYIHTLEGGDDMPAHIKSSLFGASLTIPVSNGRLNLGTWQGIYLCEFRNYGGRRRLVISVWS